MRIAIVDQGIGQKQDGPVVQAVGLINNLEKLESITSVDVVTKANYSNSSVKINHLASSSLAFSFSLLFRRRYDVVHWNYLPYNPLILLFVCFSSLVGSKNIVSIHGDLPWTEPQYTSLLRRLVEPIFYPVYFIFFKKIIFPSNCTKEILMRRTGLSGDKGVVIYNSVSESLMMGSGEVVDDSYMLCVANNDPKKNVSTLIAAFNNYRENGGRLGLYLVGSGYSGAKNKDGLKYLGMVRNDGLAKYYASCQAFVFPSMHETFGVPLAEALAFGKPVYACKKYSIPEILSEYGYYVDKCESTEDWTNIMFRIEKNEEMNNDLIEQRKKFASEFYDWKSNAVKFARVYESVGKE